MNFQKINEKIHPPDEEAMVQCRENWNSLAKPLYGLGRFEDIVIQIAGIQRTPLVSIGKKALLVLCADNGVTAEGVTQTGQEVTAIVAQNFLKGQTTACIMADRAGVDVWPVDVGMACDTAVERRKCAYGTRNIAEQPAMTRAEVETAMQTGIMLVKEKQEQGYELLLTGEMGIGNTTTSSATAAVLLGVGTDEVTGRGAGLDPQSYERKKQVVRNAVARHNPDPADVIDVLSKVGGFDLAALTGVFLGSALYQVPVLIDGFISSTAALAATRICPLVKQYAVPSHQSGEPAAAKVLQALEMEPVLLGQMNLGEGTGALALCPLLDMAVDVYNKMGTFKDINIKPYKINK